MDISQAFPQILQKAAAMSGQKQKQKQKRAGSTGPETLIVPPVKDHKHTFILLHGRGDHAVWFGGGLLDSRIPNYGLLHDAFPHAKFVFPQAPKRKCVRQPGWIMFQWFDNWGYDTEDAEKEEIKLEGLKETTRVVHDLIQTEVTLIGASNIVIGGLSQGCAASLTALLAWDGEPLAGYLGMCGHLPFRIQLEESGKAAVAMNSKDQEGIAAVNWLRSKLDLPDSNGTEAVFQRTPIFTGHGGEDKVVPTRYGRNAAECLKTLGAKSIYREYEGLVHWYSDVMLEDFVNYFKANASWDIEEASATETSS